MNRYSIAKLSAAYLVLLAFALQLAVPLVVFAEENAEEGSEPTTEQVEVEEIIPEEEEGSGEPAEQSVVIEEENEDESSPEEAQKTEESESEEGEEEEEEPVDIESLTGTSTIDTGDATAALEVETLVNTTEVTTETGTSSDESASTTIPLPQPEPELEVSATNTASATNTSMTSAETGENTASGGTATITTGDAIAYTDVLNVVNTNIVDSTGLMTFVNETLGYQDFNLTDEFELIYDFGTAQSTNACGVCGQNLTANGTNTANIHNNITVVADTGGNQALGSNASVSTGDAYAAANVINVANTNITDSQYLLLVFNNFADYAGDIVLPNSDFFARHFSGRESRPTVGITNTANITNSVETVADTGNNSGGDITTGNAYSQSSVENIVNQNIIGGGSFNMLIRVHGDWGGTINGLPDGMTWQQTSRGIELSYSPLAAGGSGNDVTVNTHNTANIHNDVKVYALTGDNEAKKDGDINTGNAHADSSIMNIANTNVISSNWSNLIFTIFGDWDGDLSFGQPNLWIGIEANSPDNPIMPGSKVEYTFTVFNHGDAKANEVKLETAFDETAVAFPGDVSRWDIGDIGPGETREFKRTAVVSESLLSHVETAIPLVARVSSSLDDADESDNEDHATIYVGEEEERSDSRGTTFEANVDVEKTASHNLAQPGDVVDYSITIFNHGGQLYDAMLVDILEDSEGNVIQEQSWPLGLVRNWEDITISYSIEFDPSIPPGTYTNYAQIIGFHGSRKPKYQVPYESRVAQHELTFGIEPQVLGMNTMTCPPYLTTYLKNGEPNNPEQVSRLQTFLNEYQGANLEVSGYFDLQTEISVRDFQQHHRAEILDPWGLERDSGIVYYTTRKKINEIMCEGTRDFPLTIAQAEEMELFKANLSAGVNDSFTPNLPNLPETKPEPAFGFVTQPNRPVKPDTTEPETPPSEPNEPSEPEESVASIAEEPSLFDTIVGHLRGWWISFKGVGSHIALK